MKGVDSGKCLCLCLFSGHKANLVRRSDRSGAICLEGRFCNDSHLMKVDFDLLRNQRIPGQALHHRAKDDLKRGV